MSPARLPIMALAICVVGPVACDVGKEAPADAAVPPGTPVEVESTPLAAVGVAQGDTLQEFGRVVTPFVLPDDRLVVPDGIAQVIRTFDFDGAHLASFGGRGEGPGEFSSLLRAWSRGDTLEAFDLNGMRITRFLPDGSVDVVALRLDRFGYTPLPGALPDGWVLSGVQNTGPGSERPPRSRDRIALSKLGFDGTSQTRLAETWGVARYTDGEGNRRVEPLSPRGLYVVRGGKLYVGETLTPRIRRYDSDGNLESEITWEATGYMDPAAALGVVRDSAIAGASPEDVASVRSDLDDAPAPESVPVFWDFLVDGEGFLWVRPYELVQHAHYLGGWSGPGPGGRWLVFSPEGDEVGAVRLPDELIPVRVGTDVMAGIARDELGVETVRVHEVRRR